MVEKPQGAGASGGGGGALASGSILLSLALSDGDGAGLEEAESDLFPESRASILSRPVCAADSYAATKSISLLRDAGH